MIYFIREGMKGIRKHGFIFAASVGVIAACLVITGSFLLLAVNIDFNLNHLISENEFIAYIDPELEEAQGQALEEKIAAVDNVREITYISSADAMNSYIERLGNSGGLYVALPENLLPARYSIQIQDVDRLEETAAQVEKLEGISHVSMSLSVAQGFSSTKKTSLAIALFMLVILLIVSVFIISNTTRMAMLGREEEIAVMKMVGATNGFVRGPFLVEGILLGVLSGLVAFALECGFYVVFQHIIDTYHFSELFYTIRFEQLCVYILILYLGSGLLVGIFGSMVAIRRLLKV